MTSCGALLCPAVWDQPLKVPKWGPYLLFFGFMLLVMAILRLATKGSEFDLLDLLFEISQFFRNT